MNLALRNARLTHLKQVVIDAPPRQFKMDRISQRTSCGTAYCAAGWAAQDLEFIKQGLELVAGEIFYNDVGPEDGRRFKALEAFFGLQRKESDLLFGSHLYGEDIVPKEEVLHNIDRLLAGKKPIRY